MFDCNLLAKSLIIVAYNISIKHYRWDRINVILWYSAEHAQKLSNGIDHLLYLITVLNYVHYGWLISSCNNSINVLSWLAERRVCQSGVCVCAWLQDGFCWLARCPERVRTHSSWQITTIFCLDGPNAKKVHKFIVQFWLISLWRL